MRPYVYIAISTAVLLAATAQAADNFRFTGSTKAKIKIEEFTDFQCPACKNAHAKVNELLKKHKGKISLSYKYYPLEFHMWAKEAAKAAECAGQQGKFWDYADMVYENQAVWSEATATPTQFDDYATKLNLDMKIFAACRANPATAVIVEKDVAEGDKRTVNATPTFFVNGKKAVGVKSLMDAIDEIQGKKPAAAATAAKIK